MNYFEKFLYFMQKEMARPKAFGWFHLLCLCLSFLVLILLYHKGKNASEKQLKIVLAFYGIIALILEIAKQIVWSFNFDAATNLITWDFQWYAFPFQLCTTPIYVSLTCLFLKKGTLRESLLAYLSFVTILGSIVTMILPDSCFVETILVNIHTMYLHCGGFVVSIFLLMNGYVKVNYKNLKNAFLVFISLVSIALLLNTIIYNIGILNGEEFNMFYISPYFTTTLPIFKTVQEITPYPLYLMIYLLTIFTGELIVFYIAKIIGKVSN